jgi:hypothetical protein
MTKRKWQVHTVELVHKAKVDDQSAGDAMEQSTPGEHDKQILVPRTTEQGYMSSEISNKIFSKIMQRTHNRHARQVITQATRLEEPMPIGATNDWSKCSLRLTDLRSCTQP